MSLPWAPKLHSSSGQGRAGQGERTGQRLLGLRRRFNLRNINRIRRVVINIDAYHVC